MTEIFKIKLGISNCYLAKGGGNILIDTGSPNEEGKIISALNKLGVALSDLSLILHTHGHSDHCGSTKALIERHKIPTAIHSSDSDMAERGRNNILRTNNPMARIAIPFIDKPFRAFKADIFIDELKNLTDYGINGKLHNTPGHTNGSISIEFDNREAIIGDLLMGGYFAGVFLPHRPNYHYFTENRMQVNSSIEKILNWECDTYYVGHGGELNGKDIARKFGLNRRNFI
jgi:hydroxyacylglutathione hydrolase